jgi:hypothetical protein
MQALFGKMLALPFQCRQVAVFCACLLLCLQIPLAYAVHIDELQVNETQGIYRINLVMQMQAPVKYVHDVLTDYKHIYRLDPTIIDSGILASPADDVVRVRTRISDCIGFFCLTLDRVEDVRELENGGLESTIVPALSNFRSGHSVWRLAGHGRRTRITYQARLEPDFFIPPLIGSYFIKKKLRKRVLTSMARIECIARIQAGLVQDSMLQPTMTRAKQTQKQARGSAIQTAGTARDATDCYRPCRIEEVSCQP